MAALLPPPKRAKLYHNHLSAAPPTDAPEQKDVVSVVVKFVEDDESGRALVPPVSLPANVTPDGLEALLNQLTTTKKCVKELVKTARVTVR
jgi:ribosome assembly protein 4